MKRFLLFLITLFLGVADLWGTTVTFGNETLLSRNRTNEFFFDAGLGDLRAAPKTGIQSGFIKECYCNEASANTDAINRNPGIPSAPIWPEIKSSKVRSAYSTVPYFENFDGVSPPQIPALMTVTNGNGDAYSWQTYASNPNSPPNSISISQNPTLPMDDWFFTPPISLIAGTAYEVKFLYRAQDQSFPEHLSVSWGDAPSSGGMTGGLIWDNSNIVNITYVTGRGIVIPSVDGQYYFGWHGSSNPNMARLYVDNISVTLMPVQSVHELYTDPSIQEGDTVNVVGFYTNPNYFFMLNFYGDWNKDQPLPAQSYLVLEGNMPDDSATNGGYILVKGIVHYVTNPNSYHSEDSLIIHLNSIQAHVYYSGTGSGLKAGYPVKGQNNEFEIIKSPLACDSCKFAVLISGGVNEANNYKKYWENLVALYKFKVENDGYCPSNVKVHYYKGVGRDGRIPAGNISPADSASIHNTFSSVAQKVAGCTAKGKPSTFQKMITNHGEEDGDICLLDKKVLKPGEVKDMEQSIINACCSKMYDELLECYAGYTVDEISTLNILNKATVYVNSNSDTNCGYSPHDSVHPYLQAKINMLKAGSSYPQAVDSARKAYQKYLQRLLTYAHWAANWYRNHPTHPKSDSLRRLWVKDSTDLANALKTTRNVVRLPMNKFCEWKEFVIPPGGQLVLDFEGNSNNCGNVTINIIDPVTGVIKEMVLNWNIPGSAGYSPGNKKRVINGDPNKSTTVRVHDDNNGPGYTLTGSCNAVRNLTQSVSNASSFAGFSFGGSDDSSEEFAVLHESTVFLPDIDHIPMHLNMLPAYLGSGFVQNFGCSFAINTSDPYWTNMELQIDVAEVLTPGNLVIATPTEMQTYELFISTPGIYTVSLGDMTLHGEVGHLYFNTTGGKSKAPSGLAFSFDSWALRTLHGYSSSNLDYGDAPDPAYPTLLASNGARHTLDNLTYLGAGVDAETDGLPGAASTGDDLNGTDDEDGVTFMWPVSPGNPCKIKVNASVGNALLNTWIDFNGNGSWADAGEQVYTDLILSAGDNYLTFVAPATSVLGQTYARFRFSHQAALSYTGAASDGEVEDYRISITDLGQIKWQQLPDTTLPGTHAHNDIRVADDWLCKGGQITDIGWWGNYELDAAGLEKRGTGISHFAVSVHLDNAATCLPVNPPVASFIVQFNSITETNTGLINNEGCPIYYYTFNLPQPFIQTVGNRYWLSIMANPNNPLTPAIWRWQEANRWYIPILCGAANETSVIPWQTILLGAPSKSMDMAFELKSQAASICIDPDPADQFVQNEISMALVPGNTPGVPTTLVAAYNDQPYGGGPGLGVSYSSDGGASWTPLQLPYPSNPFGIPYLDAFDPAATADGSGNVYVAHISTDFDWVNGPESGLYIHKSTNGGVNWASPVQISYDGKPTASPDPNYRFNDRCQIIADIHPGSAYYNNLYAVWIKDRGWNMTVPMSDIYFSSSTNGGTTWSTPVIINENQHNMANMPIPAVASDGKIYVSWMDYNVTTGGSGKIYFNTSTNGGATWLPTDTYVMPVLLPPLRLNGGSDVLAKGAAVIDVSPANPQNLYLAYAQASLNMIDEGTILFRKSTDGGATWSTPLKVNDDVTTTDQVLPWMDVKPNGTIDIAWYDRRNDPTDLKWDVYMASSTDEGNTFSVNTKVSATAAPSPSTPSGLWMGEYLGLVADTTHAYICYTLSATDSKGDIFFNKLANPTIDTDFGDAPDPTYPTLLASDGARHKIDGVTFLGNLIDIEADGQPSAAGNGDDLNNLDDEDGVTFLWPLSAGNPCKIKANASVGDALLNMWIDYNSNGSWADAGEQIFIDLNLKAGDNFLTFIAPTNITAGQTYARFRFSHQPALSFTGYAFDGEVEDYRITISPYSEKWLQMVDASHPGLHTGENTTVADDWTCNGGQVTGIHWWGNYELNTSGQEKRGSLVNHFLISIYSDVNCLPGSTLNTYTVPFSNAKETYTGVNNSESGKIYRYEFALPQAFAQVQGTSYWVGIQAYSNDALNPAVWRWQEANRWYYPIKCGAATSYQPVGWQTIFWSTPAPGQYSDMAFEINNSNILTINANIEGLFNSSSGNMNEALGLTGAEWGLGIADKITVELHDATDYNSILFSDEEVYLSTSGQATVSIPVAFSGSYYITVKHRNSIETTTSAPVSFSGSSITYSFDAPAKAYGNNMKQLAPGIYGFYSGDVYRDGVVDANDLIQVDNSAAAFSLGYLVTDVNGDGKADQSDVNLVKTNAHLFIKKRIP